MRAPALTSIRRHLDFCNCRRARSSLDGMTLDYAYRTPPVRMTA